MCTIMERKWLLWLQVFIQYIILYVQNMATVVAFFEEYFIISLKKVGKSDFL